MTIRSAVVLAAGEGARLRPLTKHRPKPMLPAATAPILEHVFDALVDAGITELTVVVGYGRTHVQSHFGSTYRDASIEYVVQDKQLGSGHALLAAEAAVSEPCLVLNGDQLVAKGIIEDVRDAHDGGAVATLGLIRHADVADYGGVILDDDGDVAELVERPRDDRSYRLNAGIYAFEPKLFEYLRGPEPQLTEYSLVDGIANAIDAGEPVRGVESDGLWIDATYPWDLLDVTETLFESDADVEHRVSSDARVHESATVVEPVAISADCVIGPGAVVGPHVALGENATVGANAVVERSVVDADTRVGSNATLVDCVTGRGVRIGAGSTVVGGPGDVRVGDRVHEDEQLGALLADRVRDGGGVTYAPGAMVGADAVVTAGATVRGTIDGETEVR
ncbi:sugar phosphate nucleotidyltransferase [Natrinema salifodinae]|uniref:Bifunctional protein GlmU n=1 Tax=Natrinema salifodinae TaxID=1202768 RepID=A0A1I0M0J6_9EURY|nr:sugar phosphate nucleotidyltransferase [Natrinema salifodinae]SEV81609.1 glucose-1-phosphate thymidylyltransferase [Natrinema salifodinae]